MVPMNSPAPTLEVRDLSKRFGKTVALTNVNLTFQAGSIVGLVGHNGAGKSTLLQHLVGLFVPTSGSIKTLGVDSLELGAEQLSRIGYVDQGANLMPWLSVESQIRYVAAMQPNWDRDLEATLRGMLGLEEERKRILKLSPGMKQRLALLLSVCHRPKLLVLDEPAAALDPIARQDAMRLILDRAIEDDATVIVSSHVLHDLEKVIDRVVLLEGGQVAVDESLDVLQETHAEWIVRDPNGHLPGRFDEPFVLSSRGDSRQLQLCVRAGADELESFRERHGCEVEARALDLERLYPLLAGQAGEGRS